MADLTGLEKRHLEQLLDMGSGYVLDFSNRTFEEFVLDATARGIFDSSYEYGSNSKANRLRRFWSVEPNQVVGTLIGALIDYGEEKALLSNAPLAQECRKIVVRLQHDGPVPEIDALAVADDGRDFELVAKEIRETLERNTPEAGLDRLHTFVVKFVRARCEERAIECSRDKPLHSIFGEYVKALQAAQLLESQMATRILKSAISTLEAFNDVRNEMSLAHDNVILNYEESLLIFNHVTSLVRFIRALEARAKRRPVTSERLTAEADIPF